MKRLITPNILTKFKDTISEEKYQTVWKKIQSYQQDKDIIKTYTETSFQSEFLDKIFGDVLGYIPRTKSLKEANLIVEHKNPNSGEKVDGAILDKNNNVKIVIELKSVKDTTAKDLLKKKRGGSDGSTPIQQGAKYLFQFPQSDLAVVSNFDTVIVFDRKEYFRQEFSLFDMDYEEFKEFYLILCSDSYWGGLTKMMINQSTTEEKEIDDEFFIKTKTLHKILHNKMKPEYADDLFNKFLALTILEDNGILPTNLVNTIHSRKDDFDHSSSTHWAVWQDFFRNLKGNKKKRDFLNISDETAEMDVWQDVSYLGRVKVPKSTLDLVTEIAQYDLWSIPLDRLFFEISRQINNPYDLIDADDQFQLYKNIMTDYLNENLATAGFQTLAFVNKQSISLDFPLVKLFNEISKEKIHENKKSNRVIMDKICDGADYYLFVSPDMLEDKEFVNSIKENVFAINLDESYGVPVVAVNMSYKCPDSIFIRQIAHDETVEESTMLREDIGDKIIVLTEDDKKWMEEYLEGSTTIGSITLGSLVTIVPKSKGKIRFNLDTKIITKFDEEINMWEKSLDDYIDSNNYIYFIPKTDFAHLIITSDDFTKLLNLTSFTKKTILDLPISQKLMSTEFLEKAKKEEELSEKINLFECKLERLQKGNDEMAILKCEQQLDRLYDEQLY